MNRAEKAALQLQAVSVLRTLKETRTYDELADETGLPAGDPNRAELEDRVRLDAEGYVDNSGVVFDQSFLDLVAPVAAEAFDFERPDVVLTAATDGITLAAALASYYDARCAYAKKSKETAVDEFIEARQRFESGIELTYYLPASAVDAGEAVLVVDDLIRSGETQELLLDIVDTADAATVGVLALIAAGNTGLRRARARVDAPAGALAHLD